MAHLKNSPSILNLKLIATFNIAVFLILGVFVVYNALHNNIFMVVFDLFGMLINLIALSISYITIQKYG